MAHGTADPQHRIDVAASRMALFAEDPLHVQRWRHDRPGGNGEARLPNGRRYPHRAMFGTCLADTLDQELAPAWQPGAVPPTASRARRGSKAALLRRSGLLPLDSLIDETMASLARTPKPPEILVGRVNPLRWAERTEKFDEVLHVINAPHRQHRRTQDD